MQTWISSFFGVDILVYSILYGQFSFGKSNGPTTKATGSDVLIQVVYFEVRSWCFSQANQVGNNGGGTMNYISFNPTFLFVCLFGSNFYCLDYVFLIRKTFSFLKHDCLMALTICLNLHCKMHFPAIYSMQNLLSDQPIQP